MDFLKLREFHLKQAVQRIKSSFRREEILLECISSISDIEVVANTLSVRLRHWAENYFPEACRTVSDEELALFLVENKNLKSDGMGAEIDKKDFSALQTLASIFNCVFEKKRKLEEYLSLLAKEVCPNLSALLGAMLAAKLVALAGCLQRLSRLPASTIQVLGASNAMLKHIQSGAKPPKHGLIFSHPFINKAPRTEQGRRARAFAAKIAIAARVDFFGGKYVGSELLKKVEARFR
ncbi:MAG: hypothetical protein HY363_00510 [Candidatus Aenigmarchaeota archaeon]|nr:hypothetical protein [Candidatus Aenigmarchaeota archaeon]